MWCSSALSVDLLALYTRLWPTGAQLRHHYWLGACSSAMTTCMRRYTASGPPHTSHGTARLTEWADSGTGSGDACSRGRHLVSEASMHSSRATHVVTGPCGWSGRVVCLIHANHTTPATDPILAPKCGAVVHLLATFWPCTLACGQSEHKYGTTTGWVRVVVP